LIPLEASSVMVVLEYRDMVPDAVIETVPPLARAMVDGETVMRAVEPSLS